jgi:hypothetical protein
MTIKIQAPNTCCSYLIPFEDIIRVETRSLTFFDVCTYNLYIIVNSYQQEESFSLFSYQQEEDMLLAYNTIAALLKETLTEPIVFEMVPMLA